jgi:hypothetical protein
VKIYVAAVEALTKKERQDETQFTFTTKIDGILSFITPLNANVLFCRWFFSLTLCTTKLKVLVLCFSYFRDNSNVLETYLKTYFQGPIPSLEVKTHYLRQHVLVIPCGP